jgi:hypothetical protein
MVMQMKSKIKRKRDKSGKSAACRNYIACISISIQHLIEKGAKNKKKTKKEDA